MPKLILAGFILLLILIGFVTFFPIGHGASLIGIALGLQLILLIGALAWAVQGQFSRYERTIREQMQSLDLSGVQLQYGATHDALTGLPNRGLFYRRLGEALTHARQENLKATVLHVNLDQFKAINDQHGHSVGDSLLQVTANRLRKSVRTTDTVARLGGDEFAVILLGAGEEAQIARIRGAIETSMAAPLDLGDITIEPACTCGHAIYPDDGVDTDPLMHVADTRMQEKRRTRAST
jgi:diguanylate cyclase (GGDEF)-like protein